MISNRKIYHGNTLSELQKMNPHCIDCIITSPPYWGLRDYGIKGQLGLETDFRDYLKKMHDIMMECHRVLKNTGTLWVNMGDTYAGIGGPRNQSRGTRESARRMMLSKGGTRIKENKIRAKSQIGIPQRFYIDMIDSGWIARNYNIWSKPNPMPASVKDRLNTTYEPVMFFAKNQKYYFDLDSIREPLRSKPKRPQIQSAEPTIQTTLLSTESTKNMNGMVHSDTNNRYANTKLKIRNGKGKSTLNTKWTKAASQPTNGTDMGDDSRYVQKGRNPGDVWQISTSPYPEAHFATFPIDLPKKIISCACPPDGMVMDIFFGSGTTGIAAEQLNRKWCGIELNPDYIEIARKRLSKYMNEKL